MPASYNPLAHAGGCPMAKRPGSSPSSPPTPPSSSSSSSEPPDTPHSHVVPAPTSYSPFTSAPLLESGLSPQGESTSPLSIPAAGRGNSPDGSEWLNPSPNALFRALRRASKPIEAADAVDVSRVHDAVTANTWACIEEYEGEHRGACKEGATLARFYGMDGIYSYKAQFVHRVLGGPLPFDRHDWVVDRCGKEVRYVIDYYSVEEANEEGEVEVSYSIDARPAPTLEGMWDRGRMAFRKYRAGEKWW